MIKGEHLLHRARAFLLHRFVYTSIAVIAGVLLMVAGLPGLRVAYRVTPWDLNVDYLSARAYLQHDNPFTPEGAVRSGVIIAGISGHGHPPTTSFWALPLARFKIRTAGHILGAFTLLLIFIEAFVLARTLAFPFPWATATLIWAYIASADFMEYHLGVGQWSGLIGFLFFVAWWAGRSRRDVISGAAIGLACTIKLFPGVLLVFLLAMRRWRAIAAAIAAYLFVAVVMTSRFGITGWKRFLAVQAQIADYWLANIQNQSIHGIVSRLFEPVCQRHGPVIPAAVTISSIIGAALVVSAAAWTWRFSRLPQTFDRAFALFVTIAMVTSQWVWEHYAVIYLLPVMLLLGALKGAGSTAGDALSPTGDMASVAGDIPRAAGAGPGAAGAIPKFTARFKVLSVVLVALIVLCWRIPRQLKANLQARVQAGHWEAHLPLHLLDLLNWLPGILLLGLLIVVFWKTSLPTGPASASAKSE